jgi:hypothetical protein
MPNPNQVSARVDFQIIYTGPALEMGVMDVRDLAPALLSLSSLVEQINLRANGAEPPVKLRFKATERGSLIAHLFLETTWLQEVVAMFTGNEAQGLERIMNMLWGGGAATGLVGLFQLIKFLRGQPPARVEPATQSTVNVYNVSGDMITTHTTTLELATDQKARQEAARVVRPLEREGVDSLTIRRQQGETEAPILKEDLQAFDVQPVDNIPTEDTSTTLLQIVRPDLSDATPRWEVTDGTSKFNARVTDEAFAERVRSREITFGHNDAIRAELTRRQYRTDRGALRTDYEIIRVMNHYPGGIPSAQLPLFPEGPLTE